jgi:outer membrane lipoprotein-sorting protein
MTRRIGAVLAMALVAGMTSPVRAADAPDANAILDKAIKALGGEEKLSKVKVISWKTKGTVTFGGNDNEISTQSTVQGLDHARLEFEGEFGGNPFKGVTVLAGDKGWRDLGGNRTELDKDALANAKQTVYLILVPVTILPLKGKEFKVEAIDEEKVGDKPAAGIKATGPDGKELRLYFDKESGLPVKMVAKVVGFMGDEYTQETTFSDYQEMGGIKKASKVQAKRDGEKFMDQQITEFKVLDEVDAKTFAEPQ